MGKFALLQYRIKPPTVVKIGNHHGGFGKALLRERGAWLDAADLAAASEDYVCLEPFVDYIHDVRYLVVGTEVFAIERVASCWKANCSPRALKVISPEPSLADMARRSAEVLGAVVLGVDFIQNKSGKWFLLESNLTPGLADMGADVERRILQLLFSLQRK